MPQERKIQAGDVVRQYRTPARASYDDATVVHVHGNGALDVEIAGIRYGWAEDHCELVRPTLSHGLR